MSYGAMIPKAKAAALDLHIWNDEHPVGTAVVYYPELPALDASKTKRTEVEAPAFILQDELVVKLRDVAGFVSLRHVHRDAAVPIEQGTEVAS